MKKIDRKVYKILDSIEKYGYKAYIVGGFVRDYLLNKKSYDIDICTNANPNKLDAIFKNGDLSNATFGCYKLNAKKYSFEFTTFRTELNYNKRKPVSINYTNDLLIDLQRRDFTINAIVMNKNNEIIDLLNGRADLEKRIIRCIGDIDKKLKEDPLRILRAVRFAIILDFEIEAEMYQYIKNNSYLVSTLSTFRIRNEIDLILKSANALKGLELLKELNLLEPLKLNYNKVNFTNNLLGMWSQMECEESLFSSKELKEINDIKTIIKYGKINEYILFNNNLNSVINAGSILGYDEKTIKKLYHSLPIKNIKDLKMSQLEIIEYLNLEGTEIKDTINLVINAIINRQIRNTKKDIINFLNRRD